MDRLRDIADEWNEILHHFARIQPGGIAPTRILAIQKASPLIVEIAGVVSLLYPILWGVNRVVATLGRIVELRKNYESLKQLQVKTQLLQGIADEARTARESIAADAADDVQKKFQCDNEARNAVQAALEKIARFIERGGKLDIDLNKAPLPENSDGSTAAPEVRSLMEHLRKELLALPPYEDHGKTE